jgi:hypothetical protein
MFVVWEECGEGKRKRKIQKSKIELSRYDKIWESWIRIGIGLELETMNDS